MHLQPPPNARDLLPPLLACLPTAFASPKPPPALLSQLSPLLRQRVNFLAETAGKDGWLPLLSWDPQRGSKLPKAVEQMDLEPHPVSGELELEEVEPARYRRLDEETLQARLEVDQFGILPVFVWCEKDKKNEGESSGWKLAELQALDQREDDTLWFESQSLAEDAAKTSSVAPSFARSHAGGLVAERGDELDDDDYWNSYDQIAEERTPASEQPPRPGGNAAGRTEADYYARYGDEVQPAMDSHDPDEVSGELGESTLKGGSLLRSEDQTRATSSNEIADQASYLRSLQPHSNWKSQDSALPIGPEQSSNGELSMPRPISPSHSHTSVDKLEEKAEKMSHSDGSDRAQLAIQQHISTDIKSLFRLAKGSGMSRADFTEIVTRELEVLSILDEND